MATYRIKRYGFTEFNDKMNSMLVPGYAAKKLNMQKINAPGYNLPSLPTLM